MKYELSCLNLGMIIFHALLRLSGMLLVNLSIVQLLLKVVLFLCPLGWRFHFKFTVFFDEKVNSTKRSSPEPKKPYHGSTLKVGLALSQDIHIHSNVDVIANDDGQDNQIILDFEVYEVLAIFIISVSLVLDEIKAGKKTQEKKDEPKSVYPPKLI